MATIENFLLKFKVDGQQAIDKASAGVKNLSDQVSQFGANTGPVGASLTDLLGKLGPIGLAAGAAAGAFAALGLRAIQLADEIADISDATNISAGALLNFKQSVMEAGGGAGDFSQLAIKLNQSIGEAAQGNDKLQNTFRTLGVYVTDAGGKIRDTEVILRDAIGALQRIEDPALRAAMATDLFGKAAARLDITKLNALRDPVADADIKRLAEYQAAIDRVRATLERKLITFFGSVAEEVEKHGARIRAEEERLNKIGITRQPIPGAVGRYGEPVSPIYTPEGGIGTRRMTAEERAALAERQRIAEMERLMAPAAGQPRWSEPQKPGGFGAPSQAKLKEQEAEAKANAKALADWNLRLNDSARQVDLNQALASANEMQSIQLTANAQIAKAREDIFARERLSREEKEMEFAEKELEIQTATANKIQQIRMKANARVYQEYEAQRQADEEAIAAQESAYQRAAVAAQEQVNNFKASREEIEKRYQLEKELQGVDTITANMRRKIFDLEQSRTQQLKELAKDQNLAYAERIKLEQQVNSEVDRAIENERLRAAESRSNQESFVYGWDEAFRKYAENAADAATQAQQYFDKFAKGFEDAFVSLFTNAKFSFKDFINSLIADFARVEAKKMFSALFGGKDGGGSILMTAFNWGKSLFGLANGGQVAANRPYVVGERGPELFIPRGQGTVIANNQLGGATSMPAQTMITYNIQAVDAASFRQLVARDPSFIYAVTEQGRRSQPSARRL